MAQSKRESLIETATNTSIGYVGALVITWVCVKFIQQQELAVLAATSVCTVWSLVRGYTVRRYFNRTRSESWK